MFYKVVNTTRQQILAKQTTKASNFFTRLKGLLFTHSLPAEHGLIIIPCNAIHSIGMAYPIDAIFFDKEQKIIGILSDFRPWKISPVFGKAYSCLELPAGTIRRTGTTIGDSLDISLTTVQ